MSESPSRPSIDQAITDSLGLSKVQVGRATGLNKSYLFPDVLIYEETIALIIKLPYSKIVCLLPKTRCTTVGPFKSTIVGYSALKLMSKESALPKDC